MVLREKMSILMCPEIFAFFVYAILKYIAVSTVKYIYMEWFFEEIKTRKYSSPQKHRCVQAERVNL